MRIGALVAALVVAAVPLAGHAEGIGPGVVAPEAAGVVINGPADSKVSTLRGRVLIVEFWASWCGPCIESMPRLDALRREVRAGGQGDRFEVLAVGLDQRLDDARRFLQVRPVSYPVVVDTVGIASRSYGVWRLPATFLVDPQGHVSQIYHGYGPGFAEDIRARVFALLRAAPPIAAQISESAGFP